MGSKGGGGSEIEVNDYYMSMHVGVAHKVDAVTGLYYGEKRFWSGYLDTNTAIGISNPGLNGGNKKEGGVVGAIQVLLGGISQVMPDALATRLGRTSGADCPGFRGVTSLFFTGTSSGGFNWSSNTPYLKPIWTTVLRAPKGLNPDKALIEIPGLTPIVESYPALELVAREAAGWRYKVVPTTLNTTPSEAFWPSEFDDSSWSIGQGPFGDRLHPAGGDWPAPNTVIPTLKSIYLRKFVNVDYPQRTIDIDILYDNYVVVWWNGAPVTSFTQTGTWTRRYTIPSDLILAENCIAVYISDSTAVFAPGNYLAAGVQVTRRATTISSTAADANPAHIIYECLTNTDWGMGESSDLIDLASFEACCDTLFDEGFGLSMIWTRQSTVEDFTNEVLKHINGVVFTNPRTGLHTMRLIRGGYDTGALRDVNPDNANMLKFSRRVWGETTNEIVVTWTNPESENEETVSLQDLGNISMQGAVISASRNYYGVRSSTLAMQLAARELRVAASPLCTCDIEMGRSAWDILPADVITLTWPEYGVAGLPMRVGTVDYGRIGDSKVKVTLVEDIFALPVSYFETPVSTEWSATRVPPSPVVTSKVFTLPAYVSAGLTAGGLPALAYPNAYAGIFAKSPSDDALTFELAGQSTDALGSVAWRGKGTLAFSSSAKLLSGLVAESESVIAAFTDLSGEGPTLAGFAFIGGGADEDSEIVLVTADNGASGYSVKRGILDTTPKAWAAGTQVWFATANSRSFDTSTLSAGISPQYKLLTNTSMGQLNISEAPIVTGLITERPHLPLRPANVKVNSVAFGNVDASGLTEVSVTWSNRNRLTEETVILGWADAGTTPEVGQTTRIVVTNDAGVELGSIGGLTGSAYTMSLAPFGSSGVIRLKTYAERAGLLSLQAFEIRLTGYGALRKTNTGDIRVTNTGDARLVEQLATGAIGGVVNSISRYALFKAGSVFIANEISTTAGLVTNYVMESSDGGATIVRNPLPSVFLSRMAAARPDGVYVSLPYYPTSNSSLRNFQLFSRDGEISIMRGVVGSPARFANTSFPADKDPISIATDGTKFVVLTVGNYIWHSTDGDNWTNMGVVTGFPMVLTMNYVGNNTNANFIASEMLWTGTSWLIGINTKLYRTTNPSALTGWTEISWAGSTQFPPNKIAKAGSALVASLLPWVGNTGNLRFERSIDDGLTWTTVFQRETSGLAQNLIIDEPIAIDGEFIAYTYNGEARRIYSTGNGAAWNVSLNTAEDFPYRGVKISDGSNIFGYSGILGYNFMYSADGVSWGQSSVV